MTTGTALTIVLAAFFTLPLGILRRMCRPRLRRRSHDRTVVPGEEAVSDAPIAVCVEQGADGHECAANHDSAAIWLVTIDTGHSFAYLPLCGVCLAELCRQLTVQSGTPSELSATGAVIDVRVSHHSSVQCVMDHQRSATWELEIGVHPNPVQLAFCDDCFEQVRRTVFKATDI